MGRLDDPRPGRRLIRAIVAFVAVGLVASAALALTTVAAPDPSAPSLAAATRASAPAASAAATPPAPSAKPTPRPMLIVPPPPSRAADRAITVRARLQTELDAIRARLAIPGVSVTIMFRDGSSWSGVSGNAVVAGDVAVQNGTAFALGSISKTYTAALILALAGDGAIDLDASARSYVKEMPLDPKITVRQLLNHTSGLDDYFLHAGIDKALLADRGAFWSVRRTLKYVAKPYFPPGRGWHYSNTNYLYLGLIAERVAGVPLAKALQDRFFGPLGLDHTWYQAVAKARAPVAHGYRFASSRRDSPPLDLSDGSSVAPFTSVVSAAGGAGSIAATSSDLAQWARLLYGGKVLGPEMTAEMLNGVAATAGYKPRVPYGLGVQAFPIDGRLTLGHSGRLLGFRAAVRHIPSEALTIAVLTNQSRADPGLIVEQLLGVIFAPDAPCFSCQHPS
jgi:D-alanyl-D-alanine carboxypeptidase